VTVGLAERVRLVERGRRRWPWLIVAVVLVVVIIGAAAGPGHAVRSPAAQLGGATARYVAADGVVVDCASVNGRAAGLPAHPAVWSMCSSTVLRLPRSAGRFELWYINGRTAVSGGVVHQGPVTLLPPPGAEFAIAVPAGEVPENSARTWQIGPRCATAP
jgi:hypothetical protein